MKIAVIYARYSSDRQTEQSIDGQLRVCREYAESRLAAKLVACTPPIRRYYRQD